MTLLKKQKSVLKEISAEITEKGLPQEICPLTVGFTGYGNVSKRRAGNIRHPSF